MIKKIRINKKWIILIIIIIVIIYNWIYNIESVSNGEYLDSLNSFDGIYTLKAYFIDGGSLSGDEIRVELVNNKNYKKKNIYLDYPKSTVNMKWIDENTVDINGKILNINDDTYDWRKNK